MNIVFMKKNNSVILFKDGEMRLEFDSEGMTIIPGDVVDEMFHLMQQQGQTYDKRSKRCNVGRTNSSYVSIIGENHLGVGFVIDIWNDGEVVLGLDDNVDRLDIPLDVRNLMFQYIAQQGREQKP